MNANEITKMAQESASNYAIDENDPLGFIFDPREIFPDVDPEFWPALMKAFHEFRATDS